MDKKFSFTKEELEKLYENHSTAEIGELRGINAEVVRRWLHRLGIKPRPSGGRRTFDPPKQELETLYQELSMKQIADKYRVGETVVWKRLKQHGIKLKDHENGGHRLKKGREFSEQHLAALRKVGIERRGKFVGEKSHNWRGGKTALGLHLRSTGAYKVWKKSSLERAGYACQECGAKHGAICDCCGTKVVLHVHHVLSFAKHEDKRFDPSNSEVLCPKCHRFKHK